MWIYPTSSASLGRINSFCGVVREKSSESSMSSDGIWGRQRQDGGVSDEKQEATGGPQASQIAIWSLDPIYRLRLPSV